MGTLSYVRGKFWYKPNPGQSLPAWAAQAGFKYDGDTLRWVTRDAAKAVKLRRFADASAELILKKHFITNFEPPEQILYPDSLQPMLFQIESAWHALTRSPAYIADEQGLGKTITSILCMNTVVGKTLIICPPFLKYNWHDEIKKWLVRGASICVVESGVDVCRAQFDAADIIILPDSLIAVPAIQHYMKDLSFEWLFVDEAHRYKSEDAQRTVALVGSEKDEKEFGKTYFHYYSVAKRTVFLSGTPIPNGKPIELYPLISRCGFEAIKWRGEIEYGKLFCAGRQVTRMEGRRAIAHWDFQGASNLKKLRLELRSKFMIRHLKRDVLSELPPKTRKLVFLDNTKRLVAFERGMLKDYTLDELMGGMMNMGQLAQYQREVGEAKIKPAIEYISDLLDNSDDSLVVFAHHIGVVEGLCIGLARHGVLKVRGGLTAKQKSETVHLFQNGEFRVIVGNIDAMGVGVTLTKAPGVVVVEPSWVPGVNEQAEDRVHRMTQNANVYIRYLVLRDSLDERKLKSVLNKERNINQVMG